MNIGILAIQGAFAEHEKALDRLGVPYFEIRRRSDLDRPISGLILPGGESTVQNRLLRDLELFDPLKEMLSAGLPVFGTCAGLLLLARNITNDSRRGFALMNITAVRNAYGRQLGSFHTKGRFADIDVVPMTFIRAPYIKSIGEGVRILSTTEKRITAARQGNMLVTAFHPELHNDGSVHRWFLEKIVKYASI